MSMQKATGQWMNNKTIVEYFDGDNSELMELLKERRDPGHNLRNEDFIDEAHAVERFKNEKYLAKFMGLKAQEPGLMYDQLWGMCLGGTDKTDIVAQVQTGANDFHNTMGALTIGFIEEPAPSGSRIDPNKAVKGDPNCFIRSKPIEMGFPVVKIAVDCSILSDVRAEDVIDRGELIAKAIVRAELGGYKTRIAAFSSTVFREDNLITALVTTVKREDEPMNYSRVLYPILEASFLRGVSFTWRATLPELRYSQTCGIGGSLYGAYNAAARREYYDDVFGDDTIVFSIGALCEEMSHDEAERYIEEQLQSRQASLVDGSQRGYIDYTKAADFGGQLVNMLLGAIVSGGPDDDDDEWDDDDDDPDYKIVG